MNEVKIEMVRIIVRRNESPEKAMRRFKKKVESEGIMRDIKKQNYYRKPSVRKKEKRIAAGKRRRKIAKRRR